MLLGARVGMEEHGHMMTNPELVPHTAWLLLDD